MNAGPLATSAFLNTQLAAASAALSWTLLEWLQNGKPTALGAVSGAVAGLATITQASGYVQPMSAIAIGLIAGVICAVMVLRVKKSFGYDDSLDAFGVHGIGGTIGALLTGIFASGAINAALGKSATGAALPTGWLEGNTHQLANQAMGVAIGWGLSVAVTLSLLVVIDKTLGLRLSATDESQGMDLVLHGEEGYDLNA